MKACPFGLCIPGPLSELHARVHGNLAAEVVYTLGRAESPEIAFEDIVLINRHSGVVSRLVLLNPIVPVPVQIPLES